METALGIILIISFIAMVIYMMRGGNPTLTLTVMAVIWALLGGRTPKEIIDITFGETITKNANVFLIMLAGGWFSQMIVQTGIASSIIRKAVELGGDRPHIVVSLLMLIVSLLFTTLFGVGPAIAIGVIILPIMMSMGIEPRIAVAAMTLSIGTASGVNISQYAGVAPLIDEGATFGSPYFPYAAVAYACALVIAIVGINIVMRKRKPSRAWAVSTVAPKNNGGTAKKIPWFAYLALLIPVVLIVVFQVHVFVAFAFGVCYTALTTADWKNRDWKHFSLILKTSADGFSDVAPVVLFILSTWLFADSARVVTPLLMNIFGGILPTTRLGVCLLFAIIAPLVVYRGPACYAGAGIALFNGILAMGTLPPAFVFTVGYSMETVHYQLDPTVSVVGWAMGYAKVKASDYLKTTLVIVWIIAVVYMALVYFMV